MNPTIVTVTILSFSYKRGLPQGDAGDGGGFVFDCRALPNPFWDESLRLFTGRDTPVVEFFAQHDAAVRPFMEAVESLVLQSVETYRQDGRTRLQVAFGCTGGQHRSVYCAERLAQALHNDGRINVQIIHTNEPNWKTSPKENQTA